MTKRSLREDLEEAATGLYYGSESDYPLGVFTLPFFTLADSENEITPEGFLHRIGVSENFIEETKLPIDRLIEERTLDGFFQSVYDKDDKPDHPPSKRPQKLKALLMKRLRSLKLLRVGQVEICCYIVGLDEHGDIAGIVTMATET